MRCLIPFAAAMVKKILLDRGYDEFRINLFKVRWNDRLVCYSSLVYRYGINTNILHLTLSRAEF